MKILSIMYDEHCLSVRKLPICSHIEKIVVAKAFYAVIDRLWMLAYGSN